MARDPVCGMDVDENAASQSLAYHGLTYWFCSEGCRAEFLRHPEEYAHPGSEGGAEDV